MRGLISILLFLLLSGSLHASTQSEDSTEVFFLTCTPGKEVVTIYGHSAIRIVKASIGLDQVYGWGNFDFSAPYFVWKFATGRLKYTIADETYERFLKEFFLENRTVYSQKINLTNAQKETLVDLININMRPDNRLYLYDFFYDNCSTRVRDIIEIVVGDKLVFPDENIDDQYTFREKINKAQGPISWLTFGTDMLIGTTGDKKAGFRDQMFLPEDLMKNLSLMKIKDSTGMIPLLQKPVTVLDFKSTSNKVILTPFIVFSILLIIIMLSSFLLKREKIIEYIDKFLFLSFSILSILMVFFNFFTDHQAMKMNLNIIWLNPLLVVAFLTLFMKNEYTIWFRIVFLTSSGFLLSFAILPQSINLACIPLILILILRSMARSDFRFATILKTESTIF